MRDSHPQPSVQESDRTVQPQARPLKPPWKGTEWFPSLLQQLAPRELVESEIEPILERSRHEDISLLVVGDPFGATTHCDLLARAKALGIPFRVVHNASIMNAIGCCGLQVDLEGLDPAAP